jgi:2-oxoglutarate dehydrogenase E2 component (dihydrolipoamide succinyltransferase)
MEIKVPPLGESVVEATVAKWFKVVGETVERDEPIVELETDKVTLEVPAAESGTLESIIVEAGKEVEVGAVLGMIGDGNGVATPTPSPTEPPVAELGPAPVEVEPDRKPAGTDISLSPAVRKMVDEGKIDPTKITGTGKGGRLTKDDVQGYLDGDQTPVPAEPQAPAAAKPVVSDDRGEERVPMTRLRKRIAERLKEAQNTAAMLTTFNEVDMTNVMAARQKYQKDFQKKHGVKLGFMSFFAKACIAALEELPAVNATIDGDDVVYRNFVDLGVAVGTEQGLVVPVLRNADNKSFADIEKEIGDLGKRARDGSLSMDDLTGGTFTVTNGGVYGSLMSTPILNPPQSGILGMHKIQPRPIAVGDAVEIRPMMYLALSYDHRIIDGSEAVTFLVRVKECIEEPDRILLGI